MVRNEFSFVLTRQEAGIANDKHWFLENKILEFKDPKEVNSYLTDMELVN